MWRFQRPDAIAVLNDELAKKSLARYFTVMQNRGPAKFMIARRLLAEFDKNGKLVRLIEKPKQPPSNYALTGIYCLTPIIYKMIKQLKPSWRGELEITEALQLLIDNDYNVGYRIVEGWWKDTGTVDDIIEANRLILDELTPKIEGPVQDKTCIQGRVTIEKDTVIKRGALILGPLAIGKNTTIEDCVYIGPYTSIGNNVTIKKGEIENSIIMDNCRIEIIDKITDSLIGPNTEISTNTKGPKGHRLIVGESSKIVL